MTKNKIIIGFSGAKGSGKSFYSDIVSKGSNYESFALADRMKKSIAKALGIDQSYFYDEKLKDKEFPWPVEFNQEIAIRIANDFNLSIPSTMDLSKKKFPRPRDAMQFIGTEFLRAIDNDVHLNYAFNKIQDIGIISDVRLLKEVDFFKQKNSVKYIQIFIHDEKAEANALKDNHVTELEFLKIKEQADLVIDNNDKSLCNTFLNLWKIQGVLNVR